MKKSRNISIGIGIVVFILIATGFIYYVYDYRSVKDGHKNDSATIPTNKADHTSRGGNQTNKTKTKRIRQDCNTIPIDIDEKRLAKITYIRKRDNFSGGAHFDLSSRSKRKDIKRKTVIDPGSGMPPSMPRDIKGVPTEHFEHDRIMRTEDGELVDLNEKYKKVITKEDRIKRKITLLRTLTRQKRYPEGSVSLQKINPEGESRLRQNVFAYFKEQLVNNKSSYDRNTIYRQAFECGLDPEALLTLESGKKTKILIGILSGNISIDQNDFLKLYTEIREEPDTQEKAVALAKLYLQKKDNRIFPFLSGIPSSQAVSIVGEMIDGTQEINQDSKYILYIAACSYTEKGYSILLQLAQNPKTTKSIRREACIYLIHWLFRKEAFDIYVDTLKQSEGENLFSMISELRGNPGLNAVLKNILIECDDNEVRKQVFAFLDRRSYDSDTVDILWDVASNTSLLQSYRAEVVKKIPWSQFSNISMDEKINCRRKTLKQWASGTGEFADAAKLCLRRTDQKDRERINPAKTKRRKAKFEKAEEMILAEINMLNSKGSNLTSLEERRKKQLNKGLYRLRKILRKYEEILQECDE